MLRRRLGGQNDGKRLTTKKTVEAMNKRLAPKSKDDERGDEIEKARLAFNAEMARHAFEYFVVLNTRNIPIGHKQKTSQATPTRPLSSATKGAAIVPLWKQTFDAEASPLHPRAAFRKMPKSVGRHHTWWTAQELYDIYIPKFLRQVAKANQAKVSYGVWIEHGKWNGRPHANLALAGLKEISAAKLTRIWEDMNGGSSEISPFELDRDTDYLWKHAVIEQRDVRGRVHEVLWMSNIWKKDRTHFKRNAPKLSPSTKGTGCITSHSYR